MTNEVRITLTKRIQEIIATEGEGAALKWCYLSMDALTVPEAREACAGLLGKETVSPLEALCIQWAAGALISDKEANELTNRMTADLLYSKGTRKESAPRSKPYIANRLKELRGKKGLTQESLSRRCGVSLTTIQKYENGTRDLLRARADVTLKISNALGVTIEELIKE